MTTPTETTTGETETNEKILPYFAFPISVLVTISIPIATGIIGFWEATGPALALIVLWLAYSTASGLYPWSMRL